MRRFVIEAIGLAAPGLASWEAAVPILRGEERYGGGDWPRYHARNLPANERRRLTPTIRLALQVAEDATQGGSAPRAVFATSCGDLELTERICRTVNTAEPAVSPTQFHNSVYNAPAGYWAIAKGALVPSTTVGLHHATFAAGLLEAAVQAWTESSPTLLVAYDYPGPAPFDAVVPVHEPFAVAMVVAASSRERGGGSPLATLRLALTDEERPLTPSRADLEPLRRACPVARSLPLLEALAQKASRHVVLPYLDGRALEVEIDAGGAPAVPERWVVETHGA